MKHGLQMALTLLLLLGDPGNPGFRGEPGPAGQKGMNMSTTDSCIMIM